jgi:two-component system phosphate regulon sensor histidine kinase PhoR
LRRPRFVWQLFTPLLAIVSGALFLIAAFSVRSLREVYEQTTSSALESQARLTAEWLGALGGLADVAGPGAAETTARLDRELKQLGAATHARITIVLPSGRVVADSNADPGLMDNHRDRPEIAAAGKDGVGRSVRFSNTLHRNLMYVAVPVSEHGQVVGIVRTGVELTALDAALHAVNARTFLGGLAILALAAATILLVARRISTPLEALEDAAASFAEGRLDARVAVAGSGEMAGLARALNRMAAELDARLRTVIRQRNEQEAVLSSMVEGVLAVDIDARVITLNRAAARLLDADPEAAIGRPVQEIAHNPELQRFALDALAADGPIERDLTLIGAEICNLQAHGAPIRDRYSRIGSVLVLNDVTRLRRLETVRSDFVANVSHELKTPITSIKGFLETLAEGAVDDPQTARRFLGIALRQADRLSAIIDDLLSLSRIEQDAESGQIPRASESVREILKGAAEVCGSKVDQKGIALEIDCPDGLEAVLNAPLVEQAVVNLIDNAIKYSPAASRVVVSAARSQDRLTIRVRDFGSGIEAAHLPRLFERFYRVDKGRSRGLGGTGLGLAIVKHIAAAHGGDVTVESEPGKGSTFSLVLVVASPDSRKTNTASTCA